MSRAQRALTAVSAGGAGLVPTTAALQAAATHCERAALALRAAAGEARAFVQRTVGVGATAAAGPAAGAGHGLVETIRQVAEAAGEATAGARQQIWHGVKVAVVVAEIARETMRPVAGLPLPVPHLRPAEHPPSISQMVEQREEHAESDWAGAEKERLNQEAEELPARLATDSVAEEPGRRKRECEREPGRPAG
ncbi:MAG: hypothetical protein ACYCO9_05110 [Streptosporangiaceae bacterium]